MHTHLCGVDYTHVHARAHTHTHTHIHTWMMACTSPSESALQSCSGLAILQLRTRQPGWDMEKRQMKVPGGSFASACTNKEGNKSFEAMGEQVLVLRAHLPAPADHSTETKLDEGAGGLVYQHRLHSRDKIR